MRSPPIGVEKLSGVFMNVKFLRKLNSFDAFLIRVGCPLLEVIRRLLITHSEHRSGHQKIVQYPLRAQIRSLEDCSVPTQSTDPVIRRLLSTHSEHRSGFKFLTTVNVRLSTKQTFTLMPPLEQGALSKRSVDDCALAHQSPLLNKFLTTVNARQLTKQTLTQHDTISRHPCYSLWLLGN